MTDSPLPKIKDYNNFIPKYLGPPKDSLARTPLQCDHVPSNYKQNATSFHNFYSRDYFSDIKALNLEYKEGLYETNYFEYENSDSEDDNHNIINHDDFEESL